MNNDTRDQVAREGERILHVVDGYEGVHLVTAATLASAAAAQTDYETESDYADFGELRKSGDLAQLAERLVDWDLSVADYTTAIERAATRPTTRSTVEERLAALVDVAFDGDDDANAPSDDTDFHSSTEVEDEVEDQYMHTIEVGMLDDVPADVLDQFDAVHAPMFSEPIAYVGQDKLDDMIAVLEARGFSIIRE